MPPDPPEPPLEPAPDPPRQTWQRVGRSVVAAAGAVLTTYLGVCVLLLMVYAVTWPPITGVQVQRWIEAQTSERVPPRRYNPVPLNRIASDLPLAVVAAEDSRFFKHSGIDWSAISKALSETFYSADTRGGSTITQQLVKNLFLTTHSTYLRKGLELPLTYAAEAILSKRRILELYLNVIEWGPGVFGAEAAAAHHFGQSAGELRRWQAAALAACIPNPLVRTPGRVQWYRRIILERMRTLEQLPSSTYPLSTHGLPSRSTVRPTTHLTSSRPHD